MHTTANPTVTDRDGNEWTENAHGRYTFIGGDAPGVELAELAAVAGPLTMEGVTLNPIRARMITSVTDPDHRENTLKGWAATDHVRATTDRVRYDDIRRGDTIVDDAGDTYRVERVRRGIREPGGITDMELTLTGTYRTFPYPVSRRDHANRAR